MTTTHMTPTGRLVTGPEAAVPSQPADASGATAAPEQLRLVVAGSVDDGKSTLVGRLLHDTKNILADTFDSMVAASTSRGADTVDLALLTDGLRAEREQGITIDVAYRYFSTPQRTFVLADTPGHVQYTRNMVTGASTADAAVILVDVRHGVSAQTRRHAALMALLRVPHVVFALNKMDAVGWSEERFDEVARDTRDLVEKVGLAGDVAVVPLSALTGEGVVAPAPAWYEGEPLLALLENLPVARDLRVENFRMPVQLVIRPRTSDHPDYRGMAGRITSGVVRLGDVVRASTLGLGSRVIGIDTPTGSAQEAGAGESVTIRLADELDVARGDVLVVESEADAPDVTSELKGVVAWLAEGSTTPRQRVLVKAGTKVVRAVLTDVTHHWDVEDSTWHPAGGAHSLGLNDIGQVVLHLAEPVAVDAYSRHRGTGAFLVIDPASGATIGGGMVGADLGLGAQAAGEEPEEESEEDWLAG